MVSSECLQDVDNWKSLSVFFQLLPSQDTGTIIYTNTTDDTISLAPNLVIACATFCFYPEQIDASVNIGNAPALSYIHAISQEISSLSFRDQVSTSSGIRDKIGFDVPIEQSIPTIDFAQVSMGSSDPAERKFVESLIQKHRSIISTSQWDLGLFNVSPAHISVKSDVVPHFSNQRPIADADVRDLAKDMIDELLRRKLICKANSPWNSPLLILKKSPREYKLGSVMSDGQLCEVPGRKRSKWDKKAGLRLVISLKKLNQCLKPRKDQGLLPRIHDQLNQLRSYSVLHSLDFSAAYWQLPITPSSQLKTAFFSLPRLMQNNICFVVYRKVFVILPRFLQIEFIILYKNIPYSIVFHI